MYETEIQTVCDFVEKNVPGSKLTLRGFGGLYLYRPADTSSMALAWHWRKQVRIGDKQYRWFDLIPPVIEGEKTRIGTYVLGCSDTMRTVEAIELVKELSAKLDEAVKAKQAAETDRQASMINHPAHYTQYKREVFEICDCFGFPLGSALKYVLRAPFKHQDITEDLGKAHRCLVHALPLKAADYLLPRNSDPTSPDVLACDYADELEEMGHSDLARIVRDIGALKIEDAIVDVFAALKGAGK